MTCVLDRKLEDLMLEYGVDAVAPRFRKMVEAKRLLSEWLRDVQKENILILYQRKIDMQMALSLLNIRQSDVHVQDTTALAIKDIEKTGDKIILDVSRSNAGCHETNTAGITNIYDLFQKHHLVFDHDFYNIWESTFYTAYGDESEDYANHDHYRIFHEYEIRHAEAKDTSSRQWYLRSLIFTCLVMRDFITAKKYLHLYIEQGYQDSPRYAEFSRDLEILLREIKDVTRQIHDCVIVYWIDALDRGALDGMPFLQAKASSCSLFTNACTPTPYTGATLNAMIAHRRMLDDRGYEMKEVTLEDSRMVQQLRENGYDFTYYGQHDYRIGAELRSIKKHFRCEPAAKIYWDFLCDLYENRKQGVFLLHSMAETHPPFRSCNAGPNCIQDEQVNYSNLNLADQKARGKNYLDSVLEFYSSFINEHNVKIYMSDHGDVTSLPLVLRKMHIHFMVESTSISPGTRDKMFSLINFDQLIHGLIQNPPIIPGEIFEDYVEIEDSDIYAIHVAKKYLTPQNFNPNMMLGYRGIVTADEIYKRRADGQEQYYYKTSCVNTVEYERYRDRVTRLRALVTSKLISADPCAGQFEHSQKAHDVCKRYALRTGGEEPGMAALRNIIHAIPDDKVIAIRGGGLHTIELLNALGKTGERVQYIIDKNKDTKSMFYGFNVISPEERALYDIDAIIISSLRYRKEMIAELKQAGEKAEIIDIYDLLEKQGLSLDRGVYERRYSEEDFLDITRE
jgi:hypothetical protein